MVAYISVDDGETAQDNGKAETLMDLGLPDTLIH